MMLNNYLDVFKTELEFLNESNLFIGGSYALILHGLEGLNDEPEDLDIIIFNPFKEQKEYLSEANGFKDCSQYITDDDKDELEPDVVEISRDGLKMNIIIEENQNPPCNRIYYKTFQVNSIKNIIEAKAHYAREKDIKALGNLKKLNFNL